MNIVNKLTIRHLKQNKRRTLVTIIGVIISVAMVTAVATLGTSFLELMQRQNIAKEGEWHVLYKDVNKEQLEAVKNDEATKKLVISSDIGYAMLDGSQNENKPYLFVKEYNTQGFKQFPIEVSEGRLPKSVNELLISEAIDKNAKVTYKIGDQLTIQVGKRIQENSEGQDTILDQSRPLQTDDDGRTETLKKTETRSFTIVGIMKRPTWEPAWAPGYTILTYLDEKMIKANDTVNATVVLNKVNKSLFTHAEELAKKNKIESVAFNNELLRYYGLTNNSSLRTTLYSLTAIIMAVIMIGSISLIYNAFAISVSERSRHLGMLSSVGATKKQKRNSVFFEGMVIGLISIPIGIICGLIGIGITFLFINTIIEGALGVTEKLTLSVTPLSIIITCVISMLTIFISTYLPALKASRVSAIDAIRQTTDIKLTGKTVKTSTFIRKLFGIEAEIGLKNLKRNKRRYQATVFSLVISIILFLSVSFFTSNIKKSMELSQAGVNYDIQVSTQEENTLELFKSIASLEDVAEYTWLKEISLTSWIDKKDIADELEIYDESSLKDGKYQYFITLTALDEKSLQKYAREIGVDYHQLTGDSGKQSAIIIDTIQYEDGDSGKFVERKAIHTKVGKSLPLYYQDWETGAEDDLNKVEIAALTDTFPMGVHSAGVGGLNVIVSEQVLKQLVKNQYQNDIHSYLYLKSSDPLKTQQKIEEMKGSIQVYNIYQQRQNEEQLLLLMSVFVYGFIALITLISVANIFNTISTSISLRKREFAMLKSVGMTPKGFNKMINYESIFYGIKSLLFGLPISIIVMYLIHMALMNSFSFSFAIPWLNILYVITGVFVIVSIAMLYSSSKVKKENIIDGLKQESI
ncbi:ABC transporter permease [Ferdinandcohnia quinoae]|uniref:FtsX-like permease family protein n=1 Tax=Fredinandcohnia quinoae TaxID=2918902 RepID=A0AAW5E0N7_9BACI|nr:FtsX-like permease family protein [Fredinandcohnia sp. SECRCQ15]MCH1624845.1 FtsX-like permease family protein [Fredinandcohnia sp. SECRCQ15]